MENFANLDLLNAWILLLLFYLPFGEGKRGAATCFISVLDQDSDKNFRAWPRQNYSTVLNCMGWNYNVAVEVFHPISKMKRSKQNDIAKLWKYSLRTGGCYLNGGMGLGGGEQTHFCVACNSKSFGLSYYLVYFA